ncbi:MAG: hypothetical protein KKA05_06975, partial [Alphaproteobacteria bacterium]|nr:hypothetical protein [Alphaproteobacteria bacterium]
MRTQSWKIYLYLAIILFGVFSALPNVLSPEMRAKLPGFMPQQPVTLGLDLRGGAHLVLEVDSREL